METARMLLLNFVSYPFDQSDIQQLDTEKWDLKKIHCGEENHDFRTVASIKVRLSFCRRVGCVMLLTGA